MDQRLRKRLVNADQFGNCCVFAPWIEVLSDVSHDMGESAALQKDGGGREGNHALIRAIERLAGLEARLPK